MAIVTLNSKIDMAKMAKKFNAIKGDWTDDSSAGAYGNGFEFVVTGSFFNTNGTTGTINTFEFDVGTESDNTTYFEITGLNKSFLSFVNYLDSGKNLEAIGYLLSDDDTIAGSSQNDVIYSFAGNDYIDGGIGADIMNGGIGNDTYVIDNLKDKVIEAASQGTDTIVFSNGIEEISLAKLANVENLTYTGTDYAGLIGNKLDNTLIGGSGENDLIGGLGNDTLTGGAGKDWFWFNTKLGSTNVDTITDFVSGEDVIVLTPKIFKQLAKSFAVDNTLADNFVTGNAALDNNDYLIFNDETKTLYFDADGSGTKASAQAICIVGTTSTITFNDIDIMSL